MRDRAIAIWGAFILTCGFGAGAGLDPSGLELFERRIRPALVEHCHDCHSAGSTRLKGGLRVDSLQGLLQGGDTGPAIAPGDPDASLLYRALAYDNPDLQMPPRSRLPDDLVNAFREWIRMGAPWPNEARVAEAGGRERFDLQGRRASHWAWAGPERPKVPEVADGAWPLNEIDRFILARLEREGLRPAAGADRAALLRRASFVVTGLPPSREETQEFLNDVREGAWERAVDRLLASPRFGERWARHWMDKTRYAETMGHEFDYAILGAWRHRDYLVRAFNADLPYDVFAKEQIAGDLMPPRWVQAGDEVVNDAVVATMQYWLCQQVHSPVDVRDHQAEVVDNQIDVVSKAFLGMTVSCARCHDHKFDAISTRDYYALHGILSSSRYAIRPVDHPGSRLAAAERLRALREEARRSVADAILARGSLEFPEEPAARGMSKLREGERRLPLESWFADGEAFTADPCASGQLIVNPGGKLGVVPFGWRHGASLSRRFQGALRSPTFTIESDYAHLRVAGRGARFSIAIEGFTLIRDPIYGSLRRAIQNPEPHWVTVDLSRWKGQRAWLEFADFTEADPAWTLGGAASAEDGWIAVGEVVFSGEATPPPAEAGGDLGDLADIVKRWRDSPGSLTPRETAWIGGLVASLEESSLGSDLRAAWTDVEAGIRKPVLVGAMQDGLGLDSPVFVRGNPRTPGEVVARRFLEAVPTAPETGAFREGSGRLALAESIADPANPLFGRVMVNWVWSHVFGRGLAPSVDNLGVLGEAPSHPELLDWLVHEFRDSGWSVKSLIREMLCSRTWQMSSRALDAVAEAKDPDNRLFHRANLRRLEGEAIRDAILAVSGRLDLTMGGPSIPVHLTPFMDGRGRPEKSGPADGAGRRSVYGEVRRNFLSPFLLAFDTPAPATTVGRRAVSNVPAQALALMNDPFVAGEARRWARRLATVAGASGGSLEAGVEHAYWEAFGRNPSEAEARAAAEFLADGSAADALERWTELCHAMFNAKEFIFVE